MIIKIKKTVIPILLCILALTAAGCAENTSRTVRIELEALDGKDEASSDALFPRFVSDNESLQKNLDKLNKETDKVRKEYEKRTEKGKEFVVHTDVSSAVNVPQCTVSWFEEHSLLADDYNLMTLAYNRITNEIMTSKDALNSLSIDGITLSTNVARLYGKLGLPGIVKETEMQGFETNENAEVTAVFMKLITQIPDPADPDEEIEEQHFYYYDLAEDSLSPLSEHGYDLP